LQIADTHFRRQFLFQLLILLNHLLTFTKVAKATWSSSRNRSLQMDFTLEGADAQWVQEMVNKATEELRQTTPNGRAFAETVNVILEREKNWVKWKNELCAPFDKEPWSAEVDGVKVMTLEEATKSMREKLRKDPPDWEWSLGSKPLTEIWGLGYRSLNDLESPSQQVLISLNSPLLTDRLQAWRRERLCKANQTRRRSYRTAQEKSCESGTCKAQSAKCYAYTSCFRTTGEGSINTAQTYVARF